MSSNNNSESNIQLPNCANYVKELPFWTRCIYFGLIGCWFINLFTSLSTNLIASGMKNTVYQFKIWTLFTNIFYSQNLLFIVIVIINFNTFLPKLQNKISSMMLIIQIFKVNLIIQILTITIQYFLESLGIASPAYNGIGGVWFSLLTKYCFYNSENRIKFCCFNWKMKKYYYPFMLFLVLTILNFTISVDYMIGILYALFEIKLCDSFNGKTICIKISTVSKMNNIESWAPFDSNKHPEYFTLKNSFENLENLPNQQISINDKSLVDPFAGKKGIRLDQA